MKTQTYTYKEANEREGCGAIEGVTIRFFIEAYLVDETHGGEDYSVIECTEEEFNAFEGDCIEYERNTLFAEGVNQVRLIKTFSE